MNLYFQKTILTKKIILIHDKRCMHTLSRTARKMHLHFPSNYKVPSKSYAIFTGNKPDANPIDSQAAINNPITIKGKHTEIHRKTCSTPDCTEKDCGLGATCLPLNSLEAVSHFTSGNPLTAQGSVHNLDIINIKGENKHQNIVVYNTPHKTNPTSEAYPTPGKSTGKATDYLHDPKNSHRIDKVVEKTKDK